MGGKDYISEAQKSLIRRASTLEIELEQMEAAMSEGVVVDPELYGRVASHLRRILESIGIPRVARDADTLDLRAYSQQVRGAYRFADDPVNADDPAIADDAEDISGAPADAVLAPRVASPPAADPYRQANNSPPCDESPPAPAPPPIPTFQMIFAGRDYHPPEPQPQPAPAAGTDAPAAPPAPAAETDAPASESDWVLPCNRAR